MLKYDGLPRPEVEEGTVNSYPELGFVMLSQSDWKLVQKFVTAARKEGLLDSDSRLRALNMKLVEHS